MRVGVFNSYCRLLVLGHESKYNKIYYAVRKYLFIFLSILTGK
jgi:hypothetical protein